MVIHIIIVDVLDVVVVVFVVFVFVVEMLFLSLHCFINSIVDDNVYI